MIAVRQGCQLNRILEGGGLDHLANVQLSERCTVRVKDGMTRQGNGFDTISSTYRRETDPPESPISGFVRCDTEKEAKCEDFMDSASLS